MAARRLLQRSDIYADNITGVDNGRDALFALRSGDYGRELCRHHPRLCTCAMMLTAKQTREDRVQALREGEDVFPTKPLAAGDLNVRNVVAATACLPKPVARKKLKCQKRL